MKEWQKCIFEDKNRPYIGSTGLCGVKNNCFILDLEHAEGCIEMDTRILPCPDCLKIAKEKAPK